MAQHITNLTPKAVIRLAAWVCCALLAVMSVSCSHDSVSDIGGVIPEHTEGYYLQLVVSVDGGNMTRGDNPYGGENGDGDVTSQYNEGTVHNATVFLFAKQFEESGKGDLIDHAIYFNKFTQENSKWIATVKLPEDGEIARYSKFYVVVVANAGDLSNKIKTIDGLRTDTIRDVIKSPAIPTGKNSLLEDASVAIANYDHFVMTSKAVSDQLTFNTTGSQIAPYVVGEVKIQRLAARIDINPNVDATGTAEANKNCQWKEADASGSIDYEKAAGYEFHVKKPDNTNTDDRFLLTEISLSNAHHGGTYIAKRVTTDRYGSIIDYFGLEDTGNKNTKYVLSYDDGTESQWSTQPLRLTQVEHNKDFIAGYTEENTDPDHVTTLHFKGIYKKVKSGDTTYENKEYQYRIRHSDPDGKGVASDPMHFGIVRNNIYRVKIAKIVKSDLEHVAVVLYWQNKDGNYEYQEDLGIEMDVDDTDNPNADDAVTPNDAPRRK